MDQQTTDSVVALVVLAILAGGGLLTWQAYDRQQSASDSMDGMMDGSGGMMDGSSGMVGGTDPVVYLVGTLLAVALLIGLYVIVRESAAPEARQQPASAGGPVTSESIPQSTPGAGDSVGGPVAGEAGDEPDTAAVSAGGTSAAAGSDAQTETTDGQHAEGEASVEGRSTERILEVLPDDERRILEPVVDSPGLTQIALRDRADFSKSKVSQTVSDLEKRGLLYREPQGRTYRVYPTDELVEDAES